MQSVAENPAILLRAEVRERLSRGFLRYDTSGRALLVSDAPRHGPLPLSAFGRFEARVCEIDSLLYIDLTEESYRQLLTIDFFVAGEFVEGWFEEQALLAAILRAGARGTPDGTVDAPLLRAAMIACAVGEAPVRAYLKTLRQAHAAALRVGSPASCRAAAALCARFLFEEKGVGLPKIAAWDLWGKEPEPS